MNTPSLHEVVSAVARDKAARNAARPKKFLPFYEGGITRLPGLPPLIWKVVFSALLGLVFVIAFITTSRQTMLEHSTWLLSLMITVSLLMLYYATDTLRRLFPHMDSRLHERGKPFSRTKQIYYRTVRKRLSNKNFLFAGICFATLNCLMGAWFGVPQTYFGAGRFALFAAFFVVGFICGMAVMAIYGVLETVKDFVKTPQLELDYSAPDGCGGMRFLGEALIKFGSVTLIVGVLIALFIVNFPWTAVDSWWVKLLRWFWIAWPFVLSLIVVLAPSAEISGVLSDYKIECQDELDGRLVHLRARANNSTVEASDRDLARKDYDYYGKQREAVYNMSTWPYGLGSTVKYAGIVAANAGTLLVGAAKTMLDRVIIP